MEILTIKDKKNWDDFLLKNNGSFLQSFDWGEFQVKNKKKVTRFAMQDRGRILAQIQIINEIFYLSKGYLYVPYGPCFEKNILKEQRKEIFNFFLKEIKKNAKNNKDVFLKIEANDSIDFLSGTKAIKRIQPRKTLILNLKEKEIFSSFHSKTRYNIRLAQKKGVKIEKAKNQRAIELFCKLIKKTSERNKFKPHLKDYYKKMAKISIVEIFLSKFENKVIGANILIFFGKRATYLHGASDYNYRNLMAPHLMQWKQIQDAKERGFEEYDFWGIDAKKWPGFTRFKKGFCDNEFEYKEGIDFVLSRLWYNAYKLKNKFF